MAMGDEKGQGATLQVEMVCLDELGPSMTVTARSIGWLTGFLCA
jgi:hypothetical protein